MILLVSANFPPEPIMAATWSKDLATDLANKHKVRVLTPRPSRPLGYSFEKSSNPETGFEHVVLDSFIYPRAKIAGRLIESYSFGRKASRHIRAYKDEIKCCYIDAWPLFAQYQIIRVLKKFSIPSVIHIQDIYPESLVDKLPFLRQLITKLLLPIDKYILNNASKIVTLSPKMKSYLQKSRTLAEDSITVVPNWQNEKLFVEKVSHNGRKPQDGEFTFMFLGSLGKTSGIDILINAFSTCDVKNSRLVIAGNGSEKERLVSLASRYRDINIEFRDAPSGKAVEIQQEADILLLSMKKGASYFALPSKLPGYMLSRKPVIACVEDGSDTAYVIKWADCGWIVMPENVDTLSDTMRQASSLPADRLKQMGDNAFNWAIKNFGKEPNLAKLVSIIEDLITK